MTTEKYERPAIKLYVAPGCGQAPLSMLCEGIEEEGLPWEVEQHTGQNATELAYEACRASRLGVGIGVTSAEIILHHDKLDPQKPLFTLSANGGAGQVRALGANAARLVKKMPFIITI